MNPVHAIPSCSMFLMIHSSHAVPPVSCYLVLPSPNTLLSTPFINILCLCSSRERPSFTPIYNSNCYITINFRPQAALPGTPPSRSCMLLLGIHHTKLPTWCTEYYLFVKYYYSPIHVSSIKYSSSGGHSCTQAAYGTVTLYKSPSVLLICS